MLYIFHETGSTFNYLGNKIMLWEWKKSYVRFVCVSVFVLFLCQFLARAFTLGSTEESMIALPAVELCMAEYGMHVVEVFKS